MCAPRRHYHDLAHLAEMWRQHKVRARGKLKALPMQRLIASAITFHDSVYDATRDDNEAASAALWQRLASGSRGLPRELIRQVGTAIRATAHHARPAADSTAHSAWMQWVLDLDLSPLASSSHRVRSNQSRLRSECPHLPAAAWAKRVERFLQELQQRDRIFRSPSSRPAFEANAQQNVSLTLDLLAKSY
jgi:predicted metal-dependent HD superfamily phosphohydrolase